MAITPMRAMYILGHSYGLNGCVGNSLLWQGSPGGGKTTLINEFGRKYLGNNVVTLEVSRMQGTDLNIPIPDHEKRRVGFYASEMIHDLVEQEHGMLFFDELTRPNNQGSLAASLNIFLEHRLGRLDFQHIHVWAACNPAEQVGGIELDPAFANRLVILDWPESVDVEDYCDHMNALDCISGKRAGGEWPEAPGNWKDEWPEAWTKANQEVCSFLRLRSDLLTETCPSTFRPWRSKRSWHTFTNVLAACILHKGTTAEIRALVGGCVGDETAHAFLSWRANANIPDPKDVVAGKIQDWDKRDAGEMFLALSVAVDHYIGEYNRGNKIPIDNFIDTMMVCADLHMEVVAPQAGRLAKHMAKHKDFPGCTAKFFQKVIPTK